MPRRSPDRIIALSAAPSVQQPASIAGALAITHVTVIDTIRGIAVPDMTVLIRGRSIDSIEKTSTVPRGATIVDGRNKFLMPGLWDMHVHLSNARASALPGLVANGVTGVRDMGSDLVEIDRWRAEIAAGRILGPSIVRAGPMLNGREFNPYQLAISNAVEARMAVRALKKVGVDVIKTHRQMPREAYFAAADEARTLGLPFAGHIPVTVSPDDAADARPTTVEHTLTLFEGTFADGGDPMKLAPAIAQWRNSGATPLFAKYVRNGTAVDPTLIALEYQVRLITSGKPDPRARYMASSVRRSADAGLAAAWQNPETYLRERQPFLAELRAVTGLMHRAGVTLVNGTDTSFLFPPGFVVHDELALLVESGLGNADVLRAATVNSAEHAGSPDAGSIAAGKRADAVLLDANPLDDIRNTQRINAVILQGRYLDRLALDRLLSEAVKLAEIS